MVAYKPYPKKKDTPTRLTRKQERRRIFQYNKTAAKKAKKAARLAAQEVEE